MSLEFVAGGSGAGKSHLVYEEMIRASLSRPEQQFLVIVPEQFTMQTQKEITEMHPGRGLLNIDVLSFQRLAWRVFSEVGGNTLPVLEETGKSFVVQKVIDDHQGELRAMGRALTRRGTVSEMKSLVSELLQYRIAPEDLTAWIDEQKETRRGRLADKLTDIRTIYEAFEQYLADHYLTAEEVPEVLCRVIGDSALVKGSRIILDGFTGFTPVQEQVVRQLLALADQVTIVLTMDTREDLLRAKSEQHLFHMSWQMYDKAVKMAAETGTELLPVREVLPGEQGRFAGNPSMAWLEKNLFRDGRKGVFTGDQKNVNIVEADSPEQEILSVTEQISRMVRQSSGRYHFRDFAVVTGDLETYARPAVRLFESAGIPYFLDRKKQIMTNPGVELIRAAINMIVQNYSYESVFRFLRTGMTDFTEEETDDLDNYCLALGIKGRKAYETPWRRTSEKQNRGNKREADPEKLLYYNNLRERFVDLTADFDAGMRARMGTVRRKTEVLYDFLVRLDLEGKLEKYQEFFRASGDPAREKEYGQIYRSVMDLLDKLVEVLGDEKMKLADYQDILDAGFQEQTIGLVPPGEDQVLIGDIERTRLKKIRVLFFVGVNDGIVPKPEPPKGILSETDREILKQAGVSLAPTAREKMYRQRYYLYLVMTKPSDRLILSYSLTAPDGSAKRPSYLIGLVRRLFGNLPVRNVAEEEQRDPTWRLETREGENAFLLEELQNVSAGTESPEGRTLIWALRHQGQGKQLDRLLRAVRTEPEAGGISARLAEKVYGRDLVMSVTRMEDFRACPCRHFLKYGLRLQERGEYAFTPADFGSIMHAALQLFSVSLQKSGRDWAGLSDPDRDRLADEAIRKAAEMNGNSALQSTERNAYMEKRLQEMMRRTVWALQEQIRRGSFRPEAFEFEFEETGFPETAGFRMDGGIRVGLYGRIDRVDTCAADGKRYVKIIDYKTGSTDLDMNQVYDGIQLQLVVYMNAALTEARRLHPSEQIQPAGIFYYHIKDPLINEVPEEERAEAILKELRPSGLVRSEYEVLRLLDHETESGASSVLPSGVKIPARPEDPDSRGSGEKRLGRKENAKARNEEEFETISRFAEGKIREIGHDMMRGNTAVRPYVQYRGGADMSACAWCAYKGVCGFDERIPGYVYRRIGNRSTDEILEKMREKNNEENGPA